MKKDRHKKDNLLVQFRSGTAIGKRLGVQARRWKLNTNEAARRLVVLALLGLAKDQYDVIKPLEEGPGVDDFAGACGQALVALDVHERMTSKPDCKPPGPEERHAFLTNWVAAFVNSHAAQEDAPVPTAGSPAVEPGVRRIRRNIGEESKGNETK